jgi:hypothetical protein
MCTPLSISLASYIINTKLVSNTHRKQNFFLYKTPTAAVFSIVVNLISLGLLAITFVSFAPVGSTSLAGLT